MMERTQAGLLAALEQDCCCCNLSGTAAVAANVCSLLVESKRDTNSK